MDIGDRVLPALPVLSIAEGSVANQSKGTLDIRQERSDYLGHGTWVL